MYEKVLIWSGAACIWITFLVIGWAYASEIASEVAQTEEGVQQVQGLYTLFVLGITLLGLGIYL